MMNTKNIQNLIRKIENGNWEEKIKASNLLVKKASLSHCIIEPLILLLNSSSGKVRNASALTLREIGDSSVVQPLLNAILNHNNLKDRSTLVYALETLDCSEKFLDIFKLALSEEAFTQLSAMNILFEQGFFVSDEEIATAFLMLTKAKNKKIHYERLKSFLGELKNEK